MSRAPASAIRLLAGAGARAHIAREGLQAGHVAALAAAAGGPKGLALLGLDEWLFGTWLACAPRPRLLAGASIGAWRMAAAMHPDGVKATQRLGEAYLELQRYSAQPRPAEVAQVCRAVAAAMLGENTGSGATPWPDHKHEALGPLAGHRQNAPDPSALTRDSQHQLAIITARARGPLAGRTDRIGFAHCAWSNLLSRERLGQHLQRVVFTGSPWSTSAGQEAPSQRWPNVMEQVRAPAPFEILDDRFETTPVALTAGNLEDALLASGSIPLVCEPVHTPVGSPQGLYWDGGLIDYHLHLPWSRLDGLVLVPHFTPYLTPGWLDKSLPWRRRGPSHLRHWLDNVVLIAPSDALLARLPNRKLPDRQDFARYGLRHDARIQDWRRAMAECAAMAEDFEAFVRRPDPACLEAL